MSFNELFSIADNIIGRVWIIWGFHTTVAVAVIGWLITQRTKKEFDNYLKILSTVVYLFFFVVVIFTFRFTYLEIESIVYDLNNNGGCINFKNGGYVNKICNWEFWEHFLYPAIACSGFLLFVLVLIWNDKIWRKFLQEKHNKIEETLTTG